MTVCRALACLILAGALLWRLFDGADPPCAHPHDEEQVRRRVSCVDAWIRDG